MMIWLIYVGFKHFSCSRIEQGCQQKCLSTAVETKPVIILTSVQGPPIEVYCIAQKPILLELGCHIWLWKSCSVCTAVFLRFRGCFGSKVTIMNIWQITIRRNWCWGNSFVFYRVPCSMVHQGSVGGWFGACQKPAISPENEHPLLDLLSKSGDAYDFQAFVCLYVVF